MPSIGDWRRVYPLTKKGIQEEVRTFRDDGPLHLHHSGHGGALASLNLRCSKKAALVNPPSICKNRSGNHSHKECRPRILKPVCTRATCLVCQIQIFLGFSPKESQPIDLGWAQNWHFNKHPKKILVRVSMRLKLENKEHNLAAALLPLGFPSAPERALNVFRSSVLSVVKVWQW